MKVAYICTVCEKMETRNVCNNVLNKFLCIAVFYDKKHYESNEKLLRNVTNRAA